MELRKSIRHGSSLCRRQRRHAVDRLAALDADALAKGGQRPLFDGVTQAADHLLHSPLLRIECVGVAAQSSGQRLITEQFTWPVVAGQMSAIYRQVQGN